MSNLEKKTIAPEERKNYIAQWKVSGLSKKKFSDQHGLKYYTFISWFGPQKKRIGTGGFREINVPSVNPVFAELVRGDLSIRFHQPFPIEYFQALIR